MHDLRHASATLALASVVAMNVVQEMLGHSSMTITADIYTSVLPQVARAAVELVPWRGPGPISSGGAPAELATEEDGPADPARPTSTDFDG